MGRFRRRERDIWKKAPTADSAETSRERRKAAPKEVRRLSDTALVKRVASECRGFRRHIAAIFALDLMATPMALLTPIPVAIAVDTVIGGKELPGIIEAIVPDYFTETPFRLLVLAAILRVAIVAVTQVQWILSFLLQTYTGEKLSLRFRAKLFRHVQRLSLGFHDRRGTADSVYRIQWDAPSIQYLTIQGVIPLISTLVTVASMIYVTAKLEMSLALVALTVSPLLILLTRYYKGRMRGRYGQAKGIESQALGVVQEVLTSLRVVKAFGREDSEENRFVHHAGESVRARLRIVMAESAFGMMMNLVTAGGAAAVLFLGARSVQAGSLTTGELLIILHYLSQLYGPMKALSSQVGALQDALASLDRAFELLDESPDVAERPDARPLGRAKGRVEFRDVYFSYDGKNDVLRGVSFDLEPGLRLGIAGRTGAGKSTLMGLLTRLYDPRQGEIRIDGVDIRDFKLADLRNQFAIVLQEPVLFSTTIAENIAYARPDSTFEDIVDAATAANAHDFISRLPDGYDTKVGERGMALSGGERQRVSLARAFLKDAPILILDEPTSAVDVKTEATIMEAMDRLMLGRTTLMIAHRLSTLDYCDIRIEMEHGRIVNAAGTDDRPLIDRSPGDISV